MPEDCAPPFGDSAAAWLAFFLANSIAASSGVRLRVSGALALSASLASKSLGSLVSFLCSFTFVSLDFVSLALVSFSTAKVSTEEALVVSASFAGASFAFFGLGAASSLLAAFLASDSTEAFLAFLSAASRTSGDLPSKVCSICFSTGAAFTFFGLGSAFALGFSFLIVSGANSIRAAFSSSSLRTLFMFLTLS